VAGALEIRRLWGFPMGAIPPDGATRTLPPLDHTLLRCIILLDRR